MAPRPRVLLFECVLGSLLLAAAVGACGDEAPMFPFSTIQQLMEGSAGLSLAQPIYVRPCRTYRVAVLRVADSTGEVVWQVFLQVDGTHFTGAYYGHAPVAQWVYQGTHEPGDGRLIVTRIEKFDETRHTSACLEWGDVT